MLIYLPSLEGGDFGKSASRPTDEKKTGEGAHRTPAYIMRITVRMHYSKPSVASQCNCIVSPLIALFDIQFLAFTYCVCSTLVGISRFSELEILKNDRDRRKTHVDRNTWYNQCTNWKKIPRGDLSPKMIFSVPHTIICF